MTIETQRLIIKTIDKINLGNIINQVRNVDLSIPVPKNPSAYHIKKFLNFNDKVRSFNSLGYFSINLKKNLKTIGLLSIIPRYLNEKLVNELGYLISKEYENNGFASEVIFCALNFVFSKTNIDKIYSLVDKDNLISKHILENKMKFDFIDVILDTNTFKNLYTIDKLKFLNKIKPFLKMVNHF